MINIAQASDVLKSSFKPIQFRTALIGLFRHRTHRLAIDDSIRKRQQGSQLSEMIKAELSHDARPQARWAGMETSASSRAPSSVTGLSSGMSTPQIASASAVVTAT